MFEINGLIKLIHRVLKTFCGIIDTLCVNFVHHETV